MHYIPKFWKDAFIVNPEIIKNLIFEGHHLIKNHQIYCLNKLNSKEIYNILIESTDSKPSAQIYYKKFFQNSNLDWKTMYMLPCIVTKDPRGMRGGGGGGVLEWIFAVVFFVFVLFCLICLICFNFSY